MFIFIRMFSKAFKICKIPERRTFTPLRYKKFLCYSHCMYSGFRNSKFSCGFPHGTFVLNDIIGKLYSSFFNIAPHIHCLPYILFLRTSVMVQYMQENDRLCRKERYLCVCVLFAGIDLTDSILLQMADGHIDSTDVLANEAKGNQNQAAKEEEDCHG